MGGTMDKLKGKLKKAEGDLTDDKVRQGQGWVEEKKGEAEEKIDRVKERIDEKLDKKTDVDVDVNVNRRP
jgi:uncharacterized protein YjbJ (UPF0337 family)